MFVNLRNSFQSVIKYTQDTSTISGAVGLKTSHLFKGRPNKPQLFFSDTRNRKQVEKIEK